MSLHILVIIALLQPITRSEIYIPDYFSYYDCDKTCIDRQLSCLIYTFNQTFINRCTLSPPACVAEASPTLVCLQPHKPAVGGESIWQKFKLTHYSNITDPVLECQKLNKEIIRVATFVGSAAILLLFVLISSLIFLCKPCRKREIPYQQIQETLPESLPNPYQSTTEPIDE